MGLGEHANLLDDALLAPDIVTAGQALFQRRLLQRKNRYRKADDEQIDSLDAHVMHRAACEREIFERENIIIVHVARAENVVRRPRIGADLIRPSGISTVFLFRPNAAARSRPLATGAMEGKWAHFTCPRSALTTYLVFP